jgi:hypothetical protein
MVSSPHRVEAEVEVEAKVAATVVVDAVEVAQLE